MSQNAAELRLEDLDIKPQIITQLKNAGIESILDLAISVPHDLITVGGGVTGSTEDVALDLVMKAKGHSWIPVFLLKIFPLRRISWREERVW